MWENSGDRELSGSAGSNKAYLTLPAGGSVRMFGIAATPGRYDRQASGRLDAWRRDYLHQAAVTDLGCAMVAVVVAVQLRFGGTATGTYGGPRHVDYPQLSGFRPALKELFDRCLAATAPILLARRPALPDETARYAEHVRRRLAVKPGLARLWQVKWPIGPVPVLVRRAGAH